MQFNELLDHRRSTRAYTGEPVTREELDTMLAAGVRAPNACNAQCWHFFCTIDRTLIARLVPEVYNRGEWLRDVGCAILICTDPAAIESRFGSIARERFAVQDTAAAATQILQCATTLGLAGCWMGAFDHEKAREFFGVSAEMEPVILLGIGHAATEPPARPRKPMDEVVTLIGDCGESAAEPAAPKPYTLRGTVLPGAMFEDLNLKEACFDNVKLSDAAFNNINLEGTAFTDINMKRTTYRGIAMEGAQFTCSDLHDVTIRNCDIAGLTIDGIDVAALIKKAKNEQ